MQNKLEPVLLRSTSQLTLLLSQMMEKKSTAPYIPKCDDHMDVSNFERSSKKLEIETYDAYTGDSEWCKEF